jgi:hypothetical protein
MHILAVVKVIVQKIIRLKISLIASVTVTDLVIGALSHAKN